MKWMILCLAMLAVMLYDLVVRVLPDTSLTREYQTSLQVSPLKTEFGSIDTVMRPDMFGAVDTEDERNEAVEQSTKPMISRVWAIVETQQNYAWVTLSNSTDDKANKDYSKVVDGQQLDGYIVSIPNRNKLLLTRDAETFEFSVFKRDTK